MLVVEFIAHEDFPLLNTDNFLPFYKKFSSEMKN